MASETLYEDDLVGDRGDAYRVARENGGYHAYTDPDGNKRKVKYTKPLKPETGFGVEFEGRPGYWYDAPIGGVGIRVDDGDSLNETG